MRALLLIGVVLAVPRPAVAKMSLARAAQALCADDNEEDHELPKEILEKAGVRGIVPLLDAMAAPRDGNKCSPDAWELAVDLLCSAQENTGGNHATPAFAPVRAALASNDPRRVGAALDVLRGLNSWTRQDLGFELIRHDRGPQPRCYRSSPMLASAAGDLARLLGRTKGERREEVLKTIGSLGLKRDGAPLVPALVALLDDRDLAEGAAVLLTTIGQPAAPAAPRLGKLLAAAPDLRLESIYASALATIGAPSLPAAAALPALLDQAGENACHTPRRFGVLFRAAVASGPQPGQPRADWQSALVSRAQSTLARIGPSCKESTIDRDVIIALSKLPRTPDLLALLEAEMTNAGAGRGRHYWAAWALRSLDAPLAPALASEQTALVGLPGQALPPPPEPDDPFAPLAKVDLVTGMNAVRPKIKDCYARHGVPGTAMVNVEISYGRVTTATVSGMFAGTATGECVERAVKTATFPVAQEFKTPYPFQLK